MKGGKMLTCLGWLLIVAEVAMVASGIARSWGNRESVDLFLRYNESVCAHMGVNPFRIWNREISHPQFCGISRPDLPDDCQVNEDGEPKRRVHAYPPWHVAFSWFYGTHSFTSTVRDFYFLTGLALMLLCWRISSVLPDMLGARLLTIGMVMTIGMGVVYSYSFGNYGVVIAGLSVLLIGCVQRNWQVAGGVCWALMMIKPQVAILMFFPLLFRKKFVTIVVAMAICILATVIVGCLYHESVCELIFQVPKIVKPYASMNNSFDRYVIPVDYLQLWRTSVMIVCAVACGFFSWRTCKDDNILVAFAPSAFFPPYWTYNTIGDTPCSWIMLVVSAGVLTELIEGKWGKRLKVVAIALVGYYGVSQLFYAVWNFSSAFSLFHRAPYEWIRRVITLPGTIAFAVLSAIALAICAKLLPRLDNPAKVI